MLTPDAFHRIPRPRLPNEPSKSSAPAAAYGYSTRKLTRPCAETLPWKSPLPGAPSLACWRAAIQASHRSPFSRLHFLRRAAPPMADTGGETARALLDAAGAAGIRLLGEVEPGVPLGDGLRLARS